MRRAGLVSLAALAACAPAVDHEAGASLFSRMCARCHGIDGTGGPPVPEGAAPRNFRDPVFWIDRSEARLRAAIAGGTRGGMPAFGNALSPAEIDALVTHLRSFTPESAS